MPVTIAPVSLPAAMATTITVRTIAGTSRMSQSMSSRSDATAPARQRHAPSASPAAAGSAAPAARRTGPPYEGAPGPGRGGRRPWAGGGRAAGAGAGLGGVGRGGVPPAVVLGRSVSGLSMANIDQRRSPWREKPHHLGRRHPNGYGQPSTTCSPRHRKRRPSASAAEHGHHGQRDLHAQEALAAPVDVLEVEQQRRLVERQAHPDAERNREQGLEAARLASGSPRRRSRTRSRCRARSGGYGAARRACCGTAPASAAAQRVGHRAHQDERGANDVRRLNIEFSRVETSR